METSINKKKIDNDEEDAMHSKSDNIEIMINDEADGVIEKLFNSLKNRCQNNLESMVVSLSSTMFIYCIINVIKQIRMVVNHT